MQAELGIVRRMWAGSGTPLAGPAHVITSQSGRSLYCAKLRDDGHICQIPAQASFGPASAFFLPASDLSRMDAEHLRDRSLNPVEDRDCPRKKLRRYGRSLALEITFRIIWRR